MMSKPEPEPKPILRQCPSPLCTFTGQDDVLQQVELYFSNGEQMQHVFVLYGLGGGGKSQIAFKFIEQSQFGTKSSQFV